MYLVQLYGDFVQLCETADVPPKYVLFSVLSTVLAAAFGGLIRGTGRLSWLACKGGFLGARGVCRWMSPQPNELSKAVLAALENGTLLHGQHSQIVAEGCVATFVTRDQDVAKGVAGTHEYRDHDGDRVRATVAVDGIAVTKMMDAAGTTRLFKLYKAKKDALAEQVRRAEAENARRLTQHMRQRRLPSKKG